MLKGDLEAVGIPYVNDAGHVADFHSLRHSFISLLAAGGIHPKLAQSLARHSDINLTMTRYTHTVLSDEAEALEALPVLPSPFDRHEHDLHVMQATGTEDSHPNRGPLYGPENGALEGLSAHLSASNADDGAAGVNAIETAKQAVCRVKAEKAGFEPALPVAQQTGLAIQRKVQTVQSEAGSLALRLRSVQDSGLSAEALTNLERIVELWPTLVDDVRRAMATLAESSAGGDS